jgi:hypothetical protein
MVLRDDHGNLIFTVCWRLPGCEDALHSELSACREGIELASLSSNPVTNHHRHGL